LELEKIKRDGEGRQWFSFFVGGFGIKRMKCILAFAATDFTAYWANAKMVREKKRSRSETTFPVFISSIISGLA
jgi:hypothetical protein